MWRLRPLRNERLQHFGRYPADAAQDGFEGPAAVDVGEEDFARAASFGAVVPALEQSEMGMAEGGEGRYYGRGELGEGGFEPGFENAASEFLCDWSLI